MMIEHLEFPLGIVAHDSGAANHIIAWLEELPEQKICALFKGPALNAWRQSDSYCREETKSISNIVSHSKMLLTGTGWSSDLEHTARKMAKTAGIRSAAVVDHWSNYKERFIRDGEELLPDKIFVSDEYAKKLATKSFPDLEIVQLENFYLENLVKKVHEHERKNQYHNECKILYVLEPIREKWPIGNALGEFQALNFFIENIKFLDLRVEPEIKLRPHPSDEPDKYDNWISEHKGRQISLEKNLTLAESIAWSDIVIGCNTYAMVVALAAGKRVISSIPPGAPPCILPQKQIKRLTDLCV